MKATDGAVDFYSKKKLFWAVFLFLITLKTHRTFIGQGDEPHYIILTESLYLDHDVQVKNNYASPWLYDIPADDHHTVVMKNGIEWPIAPVGLPLLATPVYGFAHSVMKIGTMLGFFKEKVERRIFVKNVFSITMMAVAGLFATFMFGVFGSLTENTRLAWFLALLFMLTPPLLSYGLLFYTDMPAAIMITVLFWKLYRRKEMNFADFLMICFLPWLHPRNSFVSVLLFGFFPLFPSSMFQSNFGTCQ